jgi:Ca2+/Na+ antiporter
MDGIVIMALAGACAFFLVLFRTLFNSFSVYITCVILMAVLLLIAYFFLRFIAKRKYGKEKAVMETEPETNGVAKKISKPYKRQNAHAGNYGYTVQEYLDLTEDKDGLEPETDQMSEAASGNAEMPDSRQTDKTPKARKKVSRKHVHLKQHIEKERSELFKTVLRVDLQQEQEVAIPKNVHDYSLASSLVGKPETALDTEKEVFFTEDEDRVEPHIPEDYASSSVGGEPETALHTEEKVFLTEDEENMVLEEAVNDMQDAGSLSGDAYQGDADQDMDAQIGIMPVIETEDSAPVIQENQAAEYQPLEAEPFEEETDTKDTANLDEKLNGQAEDEKSEKLEDALVESVKDGDVQIQEADSREHAIAAKADSFMDQGKYLLAYSLYENCVKNVKEINIVKEFKIKMLECLVLAGQIEDASKMVFDILNSRYDLTSSDKQQLKAHMALLNRER